MVLVSDSSCVAADFLSCLRHLEGLNRSHKQTAVSGDSARNCSVVRCAYAIKRDWYVLSLHSRAAKLSEWLRIEFEVNNFWGFSVSGNWKLQVSSVWENGRAVIRYLGLKGLSPKEVHKDEGNTRGGCLFLEQREEAEPSESKEKDFSGFLLLTLSSLNKEGIQVMHWIKDLNMSGD